MKKSIRTHNSPFYARRGLALVSVLWLVALLSLFAVGVGLLMRGDAFMAKTMKARAQAEAAADAAIYLTISAMLAADGSAKIAVDGRKTSLMFQGRAVDVRVQDEGGKIDLNFMPPEMIAALCVEAGMDAGNARNLAAFIYRKRQASQFYFKTVAQARELPGVTAQIFGRIRPSLTVYAQQNAVNLRTAPLDVLRALPAMTPANAAAVIAARQKETAQNMNDVAGQDSAEGRAYTITATVNGEDSQLTRSAVIRLTGDAVQPYWVLDWRRDDN